MRHLGSFEPLITMHVLLGLQETLLTACRAYKQSFADLRQPKFPYAVDPTLSRRRGNTLLLKLLLDPKGDSRVTQITDFPWLEL